MTSPVTTARDIPALLTRLRDEADLCRNDGAADVAALLDEAASALTARERQLAVANKLWRMCVEDGWPWAEGSTQDDLTELGLLYTKDMKAEDSGPECTNCEGDCLTCYRAVDRIEDAAMEKANG